MGPANSRGSYIGCGLRQSPTRTLQRPEEEVRRPGRPRIDNDQTATKETGGGDPGTAGPSSRAEVARSFRISCKATAPCELGPHSLRGETDRKIAAPLCGRKDGSHNAPSHQRVNSLTVRMEAWRGVESRCTRPQRAATSALTNSAFSWKFASGCGSWHHAYGGKG